ncbi:LPS-assembly lipoprotein LptE [Acidisoma silvae]|uniref:Lipoprotein n=1 Tax=Acidisoma silvae TaxID=2802396 RepID=A0A964DYI6_9PROT|nr:hypothetical protein [Acidisoma silvae]MCB8875117.1 hypothetical protein [Acidisoma silvae]
MTRSMFRHLLLGAAMSAPLLLAGCGGDDGVPQNFPPLRYNYLAPISLNVASIQTQVAFAGGQNGTDLDPMSPEAPLQAVQQLIQDRLVAGGGGGTATITVNSASINQVNDTAVGNISLRLTVRSADGRSRGYTDASISRTRTMPDDTSQAALRAFLYAMTQDMVNAENVELEYQIRQNLPRWIVGGGSAVIGGPSGPTPVQAVPLSGPGAPVMGAAMPLTAPQPLGATQPAPAMPAMPGMTMPAAVTAPPVNTDTMPGGDLGMPQGNPVPTDQDLSSPAVPAMPGAPTQLTPAMPAGAAAMPQLVPVQPNGTMGAAVPAAAIPAPASAPTPAPAPVAPKPAAPASSGVLPPLPANITP